MNSAQQSPIVVGVDGSPAAEQAACWAAREALLRGAPLVVVAVVPVEAGSPVLDVARRRGEQRLDAAERIAGEHHGGRVRVQRELRRGSPAGELVAASSAAQMLVVGDQGLDETGAGIEFGSTAEAVISHARCSVAVVRKAPAPSAEADVVVGVDAAGMADAALECAFGEAQRRGVPLLAVHTWLPEGGEHWVDPAAADPPELLERAARTMLHGRVEGWRALHPAVRVRRSVERDRPVRALLRHAERAQLLVVGSRGRGGFTGMLLGSTSRALAHSAPCPLLVVRPE